MKKIIYVLFVAIINFYSLQTFSQTSIVLQPNGADGKDADLGTKSPDGNSGNGENILGAVWTCSGSLCLNRSLIQFDFSSIPTNSTIQSAYLYLYANTISVLGHSGQPTFGTNNAGWLKRILEPWEEATVTWNNQPATSSLNQVSVPQSTSETQDYELNVTALVTDMIQKNNYGFMIQEKDELEYYNSLIFCSSDNANPAKHPKLTLTYIDNTGIDNVNASLVTVSVYPNPMDEYTTINVTGSNGKEFELHISSIIGQQIKSFMGTTGHALQINKNDLSAGLYLYEVSINGVKLAQGKLAVK